MGARLVAWSDVESRPWERGRIGAEDQGVVEQQEDGRTIFRVFCPRAEHVEIVGTFTGWHDHPVRMRRGDDGWWRTSIELRPDDHEFQYLIDRTEWRADYAAGGVRLNEFGTWVSLLTVDRAPISVQRRRLIHASAA